MLSVIRSPNVWNRPAPPGALHSAVVADCHDDVVQNVLSMIARALESYSPKLLPLIVTVEPPVVGEFGFSKLVMAGPSYVKPPTIPPRCAARIAPASKPLPVPLDRLQVIDVGETNKVRWQLEYPMDAVGDEAAAPKLVPAIVMESKLPPLVGPFGVLTIEIAGASYVNPPEDVPVMPLTMTGRLIWPIGARSAIKPCGTLHVMAVLVVHDSVAHAVETVVAATDIDGV
jgi:hypothetical protein